MPSRCVLTGELHGERTALGRVGGERAARAPQGWRFTTRKGRANLGFGVHPNLGCLSYHYKYISFVVSEYKAHARGRVIFYRVGEYYSLGLLFVWVL